MSLREIKIAPSILSADFSILAEQLRVVEKAGADLIHVDVMDGHFVPNITIGPFIVEAIDKSTKLPLDVHLMIEKPESFIEAFARAGADWISVHTETCQNLQEAITQIKSQGSAAGVALNPDTSIQTVEDVLSELDYVLIMSVFPGFSGQKFIPESLEKIYRVKEIIKKKNLQVKVEVDGGVNEFNAIDIVKAGADILVAGNSVFKQPDIAKALNDLKQIVSLS